MPRVKLIAQVKLLPSKVQAQTLKETLELANAACDWISDAAWDSQVFKQYDLHKLIYHRAREHYDLSAQVIVRCIAKVADAYKLDKETRRTFKPHGAIAFDDRILSWKTDRRLVSIWTLEGRQKISYTCGERQKRLLESRIGETDLVYRKGNFYLLAVCEVPEPTPQDVDDLLGVDFGVVNLATTSDGEVFSGSDVERVRQRYHTHRRTLQRAAEKAKQRGKRPKQIRRALKRTKGRESDFRSHTNHVISKRLVRTAKDTSRGIAIEELKGIRERTRFRKSQRARMSGWSFYQLRQFLEYKTRLNGVRLVAVDPRNTSRTCHECGHAEKANRRTQEQFECQSCGHRSLADFNAALNIRAKAKVNRPMVSERAALVAA